MAKEFEIVMGLEVHIELKTKTKIFCACTTEFGGEPNSHCCPVCIGLPGALPVLNKEVLNFALRAGLATNCDISRFSRQDRKHYFYPDLPTSYQISQGDMPLCHHGHLDIEVKGATKSIGINRIHIEEDAGKLVHKEGVGTLVDYNRSGVPLIEIVSEPDLRTGEEVKAYLQKLRAIMLYIEVSDCKMNEGSFRCDVNLSVRERGRSEYGIRSEMKNLNSFQSIMRAIDFESSRQIKELSEGREIIQETRGFDQETGKTYSMRKKEDALDYRYLPDPDLMPIVVDDELIKSIRDSLPELPDIRKSKYMERYDMSSYDAEQLVSSKDVSNYFERAVKPSKSTKTLANLMISEVFRFIDIDAFKEPFSAEYLAELVNLIEEGTINISTSKKIIEGMIDSTSSPKQIVDEQDLEQINDRELLSLIIDEAIANSQKAVEEYRSGKEKSLQSIIGQIMRTTRGKANPQIINEMLIKKLMGAS